MHRDCQGREVGERVTSARAINEDGAGYYMRLLPVLDAKIQVNEESQVFISQKPKGLRWRK